MAGSTFARLFNRTQSREHEKSQNEASPEKAPPEGCCDVVYVNNDRVARVRADMLSDDLVQQVASTFKVLAHPTRIRILRALAKEELCVCDLAQVLGLSISATSHQLGTMRTMKLVRFRTDGKLVYYSLRDRFLVDLLRDGVRHLVDPGERP